MVSHTHTHTHTQTHTQSQQSETLTSLTVLLQPLTLWQGGGEPSRPCWQVRTIPVTFSLEHYSDKEDTYYHSLAVSTQAGPRTPAWPPGHYSMNEALEQCTLMRHTCMNTHRNTHTQARAHTPNEHPCCRALVSAASRRSPRGGDVYIHRLSNGSVTESVERHDSTLCPSHSADRFLHRTHTHTVTLLCAKCSYRLRDV